jgi:hypothetical protein
MTNKTISNWIRQARFRAKKNDLYSNLEVNDIAQMLLLYNEKCAYCILNSVSTLDHPFPLKDMAPNIIANVVPTCKECKNHKKNNDLIWMYNENHITQERYLELLGELFAREQGHMIKNHVRLQAGFMGEDNDK